LRAADGATLASVDAPTLVAPVRSGERAPFRLTSQVRAADVASVTYAVRPRDDDIASPEARDLQVATYWTRPTSGDPVAVIGYEDAPGAPLAHLVYGSATNTTLATVTWPRVVAVWLGPDGRVLAVADAPVLDAGTDRAAAALSAGEAGDIVLVVDDHSIADQLERLNPLLWGVGS